MEIDLSNFYELQKKLDDCINKKHKVSYKNTFFARMLAFMVEVGELTNETRCFKYWSLNKKMSKQKILEEYVDGLHFLFSVGIPLEFDTKIKVQISKPRKTSLVKKILKIYHEINELVSSYNFCQYKKVLVSYLELIYFFNFSLDKITKAYYKKNKINYKRQEEGY